MKPRMVQMKVAKRMPKTGSRCVMEFDASEAEDPVEIMEAFERMLAAWPDSKVPSKVGVPLAGGRICACGTDHDGWVCSHCTPPPVSPKRQTED